MGSDSGGNVPRLNDLDTVPPPDGGDAYGNATVVRAAPSEILEAIRRDREREAEGKPAADKKDPSGAPVEEKKADPAASFDEGSTDVEIPQEPTSIAKMPVIDPGALKPARVPQDFEKMMSQRSDASLAGVKAQPAASDDVDVEVAAIQSKRRTNLVVSVVAVVVVGWLAIMCAMAASHCGAG